MLAYTFPGEKEAVQSEAAGADAPAAAEFVRTFVRKPGKSSTVLDFEA